AFADTRAVPIRRHTVAERVHDAGRFVAEDASLRRAHRAEATVAAPDVQLRAADVRAVDLQRESAGFGFRNRELADLERLTGFEEKSGAIDRHGENSREA